MADYADLFSTYLQNRMDQATQPFTDPSAYAQKRFGETFPTGETEEEKKKRLAKEANTPIQTQTVNHYADGSQEHNVTTQIPAPVAPESIPPAPPAPPAPPVQAVAPQPPPQMAPPPPQMAPQMAPAIAPPANPATPIINDQGQTLGHETPQQMVQGAATNAPIQQAPATPVNPAAPQMTPAVAPAPAPAVAQPPANPAAAPTSTAESLPGLQQQPYIDLLMQGQKDPAMLAKLQNDRNAPEFVRQAANTHLLGHLNAYQGQQDAETRAKDLEARANAGDPKATREIAKEFSSSTEEGSYIKAYLLQRFGLHDLAKQEQIKLGAGSQLTPITLDDGTEAIVRVRADGQATSGTRADGKALTQDELRGLAGPLGNLKTAQTQAVAGYEAVKKKLTTERESWLSRGLTEEQLAARGLDVGTIENKARQMGQDTMNAARKGFRGGPAALPTGGAAPTAPGPTGGVAIGSDLNPTLQSKIVSANRSNDQQKAIWDESVAAGRPGKTATGMPIAQPGTSQHEFANALDLPKNLTKDERQELAQKGYYQPHGIDSVHWEKISPATTAGEKTSRLLSNWDQPRPGEQTKEFDKRTATSAEEIDSLGHALTDGSMVPQDLTGRDTNVRRYAMERAKEIDPTWSATDAIARRDAMKKFTNPDSQVGKQIRSHVTAADSIEDVELAYKALQNGNLQAFNQLNNSFREKTGSPLPIDARTGMMLLGPEIIKSIMPTGGGVTERLEAQHLMNTKLSPDQQKAVFDTLKKFQGNALIAIENSWTAAKLPKDQFRERVLGDAPAAQDLLDYARKHREEIKQIKQDIAENKSAPSGATPGGAQAELDKRRKERGQ